MSDTVVKVEGLGKRFFLGHQRSGELRETLNGKLRNILMHGRIDKEEFWAVRDISFEMKRGDVVGIIGRNGAGKSTLLKILSRITEPTSGRFEINGRVSSLLEVGTGFHSELTGRENIFLNGTILGMRRTEIKRKFDEIVAFSGVENFLDTPVKHYSSGMRVRLAFSVAAHLEPEILIIDEVLAVGDAEFQKKCLGKMDEVSREKGRTIIFVSHDMAAIQNLCRHSLLLDKGTVKLEGPTNDVVNNYMLSQHVAFDFSSQASSIYKVNFLACRAYYFDGLTNERRYSDSVPAGSRMGFKLSVRNNIPAQGSLYFAITIFNSQGNKITTLDNLYTQQPITINEHEVDIICEIEAMILLAGSYHVDLWCSDGYDTYRTINKAYTFQIEQNDVFNSGRMHNSRQHGVVFLRSKWKRDD